MRQFLFGVIILLAGMPAAKAVDWDYRTDPYRKELRQCLGRDGQGDCDMVIRRVYPQYCMETGYAAAECAAAFPKDERRQWRLHEYEATYLDRLGDFYLSRDDPYWALWTWRVAVRHLRDDQIVPEIILKMVAVFQQEMHDRPLTWTENAKLLYMYYSFRELTPSGPEGDAILEMVIGRLLAVDEIRLAEQLSNDRNNFRVVGVEKARAGRDLALMLLLDRRPEQALQALGQTSFPELAPDLLQDRLWVKAKAHFDKGDYGKASLTIAGIEGKAFDSLRLEIALKQKDLTGLARQLGVMLEPVLEEGDLDAIQRDLVLGWMAALKILGDEDGIQLLDQRFRDRMTGKDLSRDYECLVTAGAESRCDAPEKHLEVLSLLPGSDLTLKRHLFGMNARYLKAENQTK
ncbi:hypothetical protein [Aestuariispira insulae]|uniref:Tetratricopeptide repeat protein n=1 Tax=Aestuariispira insulae TaxID=1461337 RepID=A0A3D9HP67_9PROT|nr:hypothetical protein [Aestuariispira insulae]RED51294.1 hypothetical protein DFP90_10394 [Aestuariispira insulae]